MKSVFCAWIKASRVASNAYIVFPLLLGAALYKQETGQVSYRFLAVTLLFSVAVQLFIVYSNDYADVETDRHNKTFTPFSGGSRVLVDGELSRRQLGTAALVALAVCMSVGLLLVFLGRSGGPVFAAISILLMWAYSYRPIRLSYRGGGELLQMAGVGGLLPLFGYYIQAGSIGLFPWGYLAVLLPLNLACAVSTTLPDEPSDRLGHKQTFSVMAGISKAKLLVVLLYVSALLIYAAANWDLLAPCRLVAVVTVPVLAAAGMMYFGMRAVPGERAMLFFVFFSIMFTVFFTAGMALVAVL